jgi:flavorubredoxin
VKGLTSSAFGSYGWSGEAVAHLMGLLAEMKVETVGEGIKVKNVPTPDDLAACSSLGGKLSEILKEKIS